MIKKSAYNKQWHIDNKDHKNDIRLQRRYGITLTQLIEFTEFCENKCAICGEEETTVHGQSKKVQPLSIDHDHKLGHIRGLLCNKCNNGLGLFKDNVELLSSAIEYLTNYKEVLEEHNAVNQIALEKGIQTQSGGGDVVG